MRAATKRQPIDMEIVRQFPLLAPWVWIIPPPYEWRRA